MKKISHFKLKGYSKLEIQTIQQKWDELVANRNKQKGTGFENELVKALTKAEFKDCKRAWGSDGRSLGMMPDVDLVADGIKIQAKRRKVIPKWMHLGSCDALMFRADRGLTHVCLTLNDWIRLVKKGRE